MTNPAHNTGFALCGGDTKLWFGNKIAANCYCFYHLRWYPLRFLAACVANHNKCLYF